ncbi:type 1 fimbrial protein, partial [Citrobacter freundii]|nr:type 1 fimbrial protein [Citrobacter freundii]
PTELYGGNNGAAAVLYRSGSPNSLLVLNSSTPFDWTSTERTNKALNLVLSLRPTSYSTTATSGTFNGSLTFTTTYQ